MVSLKARIIVYVLQLRAALAQGLSGSLFLSPESARERLGAALQRSGFAHGTAMTLKMCSELFSL
jgi:hypothetical protein